MRASQMLTGISKTLNNTSVPGRNGVIGKIPSYRGAPSTTIIVKTPGTALDQLYSLFTQNNGVGFLELTADTSRAALFELQSIDSAGRTAGDESVVVTIVVRFPTADWRAVAETVIAPATVSTSPASTNLLAGITAEISDEDVFIGGNFSTFKLTDVGSGSWLSSRIAWPYVASTGMLYQGSTGRAFRATTAAPWTPTTDMSGYVDLSGGGFRITPDPATGIDNPSANLSLVTGAQTSLTFGLRAYNAYLLRNGDL
jgi:hypothetical protein